MEKEAEQKNRAGHA